MSVCLGKRVCACIIQEYAYAHGNFVISTFVRTDPGCEREQFWRKKQLSKKMYVGNLSFEATEEQVRELFAPYGSIESLNMITDRQTGQFRGFCFVEMETSAANAAISALDNHQLDGRTLKVNEAKPREERGGGFRGGNNNRGGGNRGGNGNRGGYSRR